MLTEILIITAELTGTTAALDGSWSAEWEFTCCSPMSGWVSVYSDEHTEVSFVLEADGPWIHQQSIQGMTTFILALPVGGGWMMHKDYESPVTWLNGSNWIIAPTWMGGTGAGFLEFQWSPPVYVPVWPGPLHVKMNWQQTPGMGVTIGMFKPYLKTWDLNADGAVDTADLLLMLGSWGEYDIGDLLSILEAWSP